MNLRHLIFLLPLVATLTFSPGCIDFSAPRNLTGSGMDMFAPFAMRVHPLTRILPNQSAAPIEVHIEFTDQMGDVTKGAGQLTFHVSHNGISGLLRQNVPLQNPTADLHTPRANSQAWDAITRTYVFKLQPKDNLIFNPGETCLVTAKMTFDNGTSLTAEKEIAVNK